MYRDRDVLLHEKFSNLAQASSCRLTKYVNTDTQTKKIYNIFY